MDKDILKIDLDKKSYEEALNELKERFAYMHDLHLFHIDNIEHICLVHKTNYSCKVWLNVKLPEHFIIILQLICGSDWRKEVNTCLNHYKLGMEYSNRMFDVKRYKKGEIRNAKFIDITDEIYNYVNSSERVKKCN